MAQVNISELADEINLDPKNLGLPALRDAGDVAGILDKLHEVGATDETIVRESVQARELIGVIRGADYIAMATSTNGEHKKTAWSDILRSIPDGGFRLQDISVQVILIWPDSPTLTALQALETRSASRAEVLWGEGARVTKTQAWEALR